MENVCDFGLESFVIFPFLPHLDKRGLLFFLLVNRFAFLENLLDPRVDMFQKLLAALLRPVVSPRRIGPDLAAVHK